MPSSDQENGTPKTFDYIVIGAGTAGTVIASRLHQGNPTLSILLIEAGPDSSKTALAQTVSSPLSAPFLQGTELDWNYASTPQNHLAGRQIYGGGGKALGGSTVINYGTWTRGDRQDYATWAEKVGDERYSWEGFLPYFRRTETHFDGGARGKEKQDESVHGYEGPVHTASATSSGRKYPLREPILKAWAEFGVERQESGDINDGSPLGVAEGVEARKDGKRVIASEVYPLDGVTVASSTLVRKVLFTSTYEGEKVATGVELTNGRAFTTRREVILCAGAFRTPQLLVLSGIGPPEELKKHGIECMAASPEVGKNLWDHLILLQRWKLRNPNLAGAVGSAKFHADPAFLKGNPMDWYTTVSVPKNELNSALEKDGEEVADSDLLLAGPRCHLGLFVNYVGLPIDGSLITTFLQNLLPTARGKITLASTDPADNPIVDHNHYSTEADRYRLRTGVRMATKLMKTPAGKEIVVGEAIDEGLVAISDTATDAEIDVRLHSGLRYVVKPKIRTKTNCLKHSSPSCRDSINGQSGGH